MRSGIGVSRQAGKAAAAASTAAFTSSNVQHGASAACWPVLGFITGMYLPVFDSSHWLLMQIFNRLMPEGFCCGFDSLCAAWEGCVATLICFVSWKSLWH